MYNLQGKFWNAAGVLILILITIGGCISQPTLPDMELTLVSIDGMEKVVTKEDIGNLKEIEGRGGFKNRAGIIIGPDTFKGVLLSDLSDLVGGIDDSKMLRVTASDGYKINLTYKQVYGDIITFDLSGIEVKSSIPLYVILAYYMNEKPLDPEIDGTLRIAIVGDEALITESQFWVKFVVKIEIIHA